MFDDELRRGAFDAESVDDHIEGEMELAVERKRLALGEREG